MLNDPKEHLLRLDEYFTYLGSAFRNRFSAHSESAEALAIMIENYADLCRRRMKAVDFNNEFIQLTGRLAEFLGIFSIKFNSANVTSLLWRLFLTWANDLINLGPNRARSVDLFNELFNSDLFLDDQLNPLRGYDERLTAEPFSFKVTLKNQNLDPRFDNANFDQLFSTFKDILPVYLVFDITFVLTFHDSLPFTEGGVDPDTVHIKEFLAFGDRLTFDEVHTGNVAVFIRDLGNFDASVGSFAQYQNLRVGDYFKVVRDGLGSLVTLMAGDTLEAVNNVLGTPTLSDFVVHTAPAAYYAEVEPHSFEALAVSAVELNFDSSAPANAALTAAAIAAVAAMDRNTLPAPAALQFSSYYAPQDVPPTVASWPTPDAGLYVLAAGVGIRGNVVFQTLNRFFTP